MEQLLPSISLEQPWRTRAIVAGALAILEFFVLLIAILALVSRPLSHRVQQAAQAKVMAPIVKPKPAHKAKPKPKAPAAPKLARTETSVLVLNGNGRSGTAHQEADRIRGLGYLIGGVGNAPRTDYPQTLVMYRKGYKPEARRLAHDVGARLISPLDGLTAKDLLGAHLALVLGQ
jgi:LytR cell envelope-related transcriptional attenuator